MDNLVMSQALAIVSGNPDIEWTHGDDLCDCTFQRIGWWTNPYMAETLLVRVCCIWEDIYRQYPQFVQRVSGYNDPNTGEYVSEPQDWDSAEGDMPKHLWHRYLAKKTGKSLEEVREEYKNQEPPKAVVKE